MEILKITADYASKINTVQSINDENNIIILILYPSISSIPRLSVFLFLSGFIILDK